MNSKIIQTKIMSPIFIKKPVYSPKAGNKKSEKLYKDAMARIINKLDSDYSPSKKMQN